MSRRYLILAAVLGCGVIGCTQDSSTTTTAEVINPEAIESYKTSYSLADEPTQVVSILNTRAHLSEPAHGNIPGLGNAGHGIIEHGDHAHAAHAEHDHDHDGHAHDADGHDHGEQGSDHAHAHGDHDGHGHAEHAGHDHGDHTGHDHGDHAGHGHDAHAGHDHSEHGHSHGAHGVHRDAVVLIGKVGGAPGAERSSAHFPFEKGKATFVMFDPSFETEAGEGHQHAEGVECHFCQSKAQDAQAIVRFVGKDGKPLPVDARELFNIKENDLVVVKGHASVEAGMLIVDGEGLYVRE